MLDEKTMENYDDEWDSMLDSILPRDSQWYSIIRFGAVDYDAITIIGSYY